MYRKFIIYSKKRQGGNNGTVSSFPQMLLGLGLGIIILVFLSLKTKIHTFIALVAKNWHRFSWRVLPALSVMKSLTDGFGNTLRSTGIIIGLGVMMGIIFRRIWSRRAIGIHRNKKIGKNKEEWALGLTGYIVSIPVFADSALVILTHAKALSKLTGKSVVGLGLALAFGLQLTHVFVPPESINGCRNFRSRCWNNDIEWDFIYNSSIHYEHTLL